MKPSFVTSVLIAGSVLLSACSQTSSEDEALKKQQERIANAARYRIVNLTDSSVSGTMNKQPFNGLNYCKSTPWVKHASGKELVIESGAAVSNDKLPAKGRRTYYLVDGGGQLVFVTIDNEPFEPKPSPQVQGVNLSDAAVDFKGDLDGRPLALGKAEPGQMSSEPVGFEVGKLAVSATVAGKTLKSDTVTVTPQNTFSAVVFKDKSGTYRLVLIVNYEKSGITGAGSTSIG